MTRPIKGQMPRQPQSAVVIPSPHLAAEAEFARLLWCAQEKKDFQPRTLSPEAQDLIKRMIRAAMHGKNLDCLPLSKQALQLIDEAEVLKTQLGGHILQNQLEIALVSY